jgi:hypothetical protein
MARSDPPDRLVRQVHRELSELLDLRVRLGRKECRDRLVLWERPVLPVQLARKVCKVLQDQQDQQDLKDFRVQQEQQVRRGRQERAPARISRLAPQ